MTPLIPPRPAHTLSEDEFYALGQPWPWRLMARVRGWFAAPVTSDRAVYPSKCPASR